MVGQANICLESVGEEDEEGVRKVLHMGEGGEIITAAQAGHIIVGDPNNLADIHGEFLYKLIIFFKFDKLNHLFLPILARRSFLI